MIYQIVQRYARAIFESAKENNKLNELNVDFLMIKSILSQSIELNDFVLNPVISENKRRKVLEQIFRGKVQDITYRFLMFLETKKRLFLLERIADSFESIYLKFTKTVKATITSSMKLSDAQVAEICKNLEKKINLKILPNLNVDEELIGGVKIQIEDKVYDYSIKTQLNSFYQRCLHGN